MYGQIPAETLAELLLYLNEHESFASLKSLGTVSRQSLSAAIEALAQELKTQSKAQAEVPDFREWKELAAPYREILAKLSPREAQLLLKGLGN
ncbi:hypothetical protein FBR05_11180 [Deltaproteobacteria bacterium PRO3]|nr:hypothetical protein [Deltaproteobacteria bacterium PRO3]